MKWMARPSKTITIIGENIVKYIKIVDEKILDLKRGSFHENTRKYIQILLTFHFETIEPLVGFIVNQLQNFKKSRIIENNE
jgi:hypothetical protein